MPFPIDKKIEISRELLDHHGAAILADPKAAALLSELVARSVFLTAFMAQLLMPAICSRCGSGPRGGCCSPEMGDDSDIILLLMNLLAGCDVSVQRQDGVECFFLGPQGCVLRFKPFFCLNYNCRKIIDGMSKELMREVEKQNGRLLYQQYLLEQHIMMFFRLKNIGKTQRLVL